MLACKHMYALKGFLLCMSTCVSLIENVDLEAFLLLLNIVFSSSNLACYLPALRELASGELKQSLQSQKHN